MAVPELCRAFASMLLQSSGKLTVTQSFASQSLTRCIHRSCRLDNNTKYTKLSLIKQGIDVNKYTLKPLQLPRTGGRGLDGKTENHRRAGGHKRNFRMVDFKRVGPTEGEPLVERVQRVRYDPFRSADIAIVAGGNSKRYILASENMKPGDLIRTSGKLTRMAVRGAEGDAYPVGSLPVGSLVHNLEVFSGRGGAIARAAGTSAQLVRKVGDRCILRMPSKREIDVSQECMATLGRVSNVEHNKRIIGKAGRNRWLGIRPKSGWWHRKTGYNGRKIRPIKPTIAYLTPKPPKATVFKCTF